MTKVKKKTNKSIASRFKVTSKGKLKARHAGLNHILTKKTSKRKRQLAQPVVLEGAQAKNYKKLIGA